MLQAVELRRVYHEGLPTEKVALHGLNLTIPPGEIFCLLGQNGAGKTTTINLFLGFAAATSGQALINGVAVTPTDNATKRFLAYIPEVVMLYGNLTGLENLEYFSRLAGFRFAAAALRDFLLRAGLPADAHGRRVGTYSKGMRQKVGIAIALAKNADVILMDEPTSGLDPKATNEFTEIVRDLGRQGKAVLMATHDIFNAVNVGTRIGIMREGQLVHTTATAHITALELQQLYLTI